MDSEFITLAMLKTDRLHGLLPGYVTVRKKPANTVNPLCGPDEDSSMTQLRDLLRQVFQRIGPPDSGPLHITQAG
jgi:hypothetical protein